MNELKDTTLARPMDKTVSGGELAALRQLAAELNDPRITGAVVEEGQAAEINPTPTPDPAAKPFPSAGAPAINTPPPNRVVDHQPGQNLQAPPVAADQPIRATVVPKRILFTGKSRVGKSYLAEQAGIKTFELDEPIYAMARESFGDQSEKHFATFVREMRIIGDGDISQEFPYSAARAMAVTRIRGSGKAGLNLFGIDPKGFGTPNFWALSLAARVKAFEEKNPGAPVGVTRISSEGEYKLLRAEGFTHFHVTCSSMIWSSRGGAADQVRDKLHLGIDKDVDVKISRDRNGAKLYCVWSDQNYPAPSPRLITVNEFIAFINRK